MSEIIQTYEQINDQANSGRMPTVLIHRTDGRIQTAVLETKFEQPSPKTAARVRFYDNDGADFYKIVSTEGLSDQTQAHLAKELAESAERPDDAWRREVQKGIVDTAIGMSIEGVGGTVYTKENGERDRYVLRDTDIAKALDEIKRIIGPSSPTSELGRVLLALGQEPKLILQRLNPNKLSNDDDRMSVLHALRRAIDTLGDSNQLPERVQRNDKSNLKRVNRRKLHNQDTYESREYAARLALAMLDGSFIYNEDGSYLDDSSLPSDNPQNGQHRQAARMALEAAYSQDLSPKIDSEEIDSEEIRAYIRNITSHMDEMVRRSIDTIMIANAELMSNNAISVHENGVLIARLIDTLGDEVAHEVYQLSLIPDQEHLSNHDRKVKEILTERITVLNNLVNHHVKESYAYRQFAYRSDPQDLSDPGFLKDLIADLEHIKTRMASVIDM
jgi:hypothetical protein